VKLPIHAALDAAEGTLFEADAAPAEVRVVTDTRTLEPGDTFLALRGPNFNGHDYTAEAVRKGAAMVVIDEPQARVPGTPAMLVERTLRAYMGLAAASRARFAGRVIGITGSAGKTTTKGLMLQLLATHYGDRVAASPANENNEIGVSRLLLDLSNERHDVAVVEMGARHPGDIALLVHIARPQIGVLTNVGEAHLEIMGSRRELEDTKWALFGLGAKAVINANDDVSIERAGTLAEPPHWFAARAADAAVDPSARTTALLGSTRLLECEDGRTREYAVDVRLPGHHNRSNLAAALAGALEAGASLEPMIAAIPALELPEGRYQSIRLAGRPRIVYDAYNANASGVVAALDAFAQEAGERRIAVLASMAELGGEALELHERVGAHAATKVDVLLAGGEFAETLARAAERAGLSSERIVRFATNGEAAAWLRANARPEDVVLLKGSRKYKLEEIVEELKP
jgi:UDP-N-acetylmuramoyl-tripeptide--D-alanyl-D-alanine ligase